MGFEYLGKGYASEACDALLNYAVKTTSYIRFKASVYRGNIGSSKVLGKVDFTQTGEGTVFRLSEGRGITRLNYEYCL